MQNENHEYAIKDFRAQLQAFTDMKEKGRRIRSRTKWMRSGNRMNKYIFSFVKERPPEGLITKLYEEDDIVVSSCLDFA